MSTRTFFNLLANGRLLPPWLAGLSTALLAALGPLIAAWEQYAPLDMGLADMLTAIGEDTTLMAWLPAPIAGGLAYVARRLLPDTNADSDDSEPEAEETNSEDRTDHADRHRRWRYDLVGDATLDRSDRVNAIFERLDELQRQIANNTSTTPTVEDTFDEQPAKQPDPQQLVVGKVGNPLKVNAFAHFSDMVQGGLIRGESADRALKLMDRYESVDPVVKIDERLRSIEDRQNLQSRRSDALREKIKATESWAREGIAKLQEFDEMVMGQMNSIIDRLSIEDHIDIDLDETTVVDEPPVSYEVEHSPPLTSKPDTTPATNRAPISIRNDNPGNLRPTADGGNRWRGEIDSTNGYARFENITYGTRALLYLLKISYGGRMGLLTINDIVDRYAPSHDNSAESRKGYKSFLSRRLYTDINAEIDMADKEELFALAEAIAHFEAGQENKGMTRVVLEEAFAMLPPPKSGIL